MNSSVSSTSYQAKSLKENVTYKFRVMAENKLGYGPALESDEVKPKNPFCKLISSNFFPIKFFL